MAWEPGTLRDAYRLTVSDSLLGVALTDAEYSVQLYLGTPHAGEPIRCIWQLYHPSDWFQGTLTLPVRCHTLTAITRDNADISESYYLSGEWTVQRRWPLWSGFSTVTADLIPYDDTSHRDAAVAAFVLEYIGYAKAEQGRGWLRILNDFRGPSLTGRMPDEWGLINPSGGVAPPVADSHVYIGTLPAADSPIVLADFTAQPHEEFDLPTWTGLRYPVIMRAATNPITNIVIGSLDQTEAFVSSTRTISGTRYNVWVSRLPVDGAIASNEVARVSPQ